MIVQHVRAFCFVTSLFGSLINTRALYCLLCEIWLNLLQPAASSRVYLPEHHYEPSVTKVLSPTRRVPSPIGPRSPSPKHNRSSTPSLPASELSAKRAYHYFNPHTQVRRCWLQAPLSMHEVLMKFALTNWKLLFNYMKY